MQYPKVLMAMLPFLVTGCLDIFDEDDSSFYVPPSSSPAIPLSTPHNNCGCPEQTPALPGAPEEGAFPVAKAESADEDWQPLDGHLVRAGDLVMELKKSKGGVAPSHQEMAVHIQAKMGLTASQAEKVLEELGL